MPRVTKVQLQKKYGTAQNVILFLVAVVGFQIYVMYKLRNRVSEEMKHSNDYFYELAMCQRKAFSSKESECRCI